MTTLNIQQDDVGRVRLKGHTLKLTRLLVLEQMGCEKWRRQDDVGQMKLKEHNIINIICLLI